MVNEHKRQAKQQRRPKFQPGTCAGDMPTTTTEIPGRRYERHETHAIHQSIFDTGVTNTVSARLFSGAFAQHSKKGMRDGIEPRTKNRIDTRIYLVILHGYRKDTWYYQDKFEIPHVQRKEHRLEK